TTTSAIPYGTHVANQAGIYFDGNDVVMTNEFRTRVGFCDYSLKVLENVTDKVLIFPNPTGDIVNIKANSDTYNSYTVTNAVGQSLLSGKIEHASTSINLQMLPAGLYYISIRGAQNTKIEKITKQ